MPGVQTVLPPGYLCCGYPQRGSGQFDKADKMITDNRVLFHPRGQYAQLPGHQDRGGELRHLLRPASGVPVRQDFSGSRIIDIHEYLLEKGITLPAGQGGYLYHEPRHNPMKQGDSMKTVRALVGDKVLKSERCCGESARWA